MTWIDKISIAGIVISAIGILISIFIIWMQGWFYLRNQKKYFMTEKINNYNEVFSKEAGLDKNTLRRLELYYDVQEKLSFYNTNYKEIKRDFFIMQTKKMIAQLNINNIKFNEKYWTAEGKNGLIFIEKFKRCDLGFGVYWSYKLANNDNGERISIFFRLDNMSFKIQGSNDVLEKKLKKNVPNIERENQQQSIDKILIKIINSQTWFNKWKIKSTFKIKLDKTK